MVEIDIHIPRPWLTLGLLAVVLWAVTIVHTNQTMRGDTAIPYTDAGGPMEDRLWRAYDAEESILRARIARDVLAQKQQILRYQIAVLEEELRGAEGDADLLLQAQDQLMALVRDAQAADDSIRESLFQLWEAQGRGALASMGAEGVAPAQLAWPVPSDGGVTARFLDEAYKEAIGMDHYAVDLRAAQNTPVRAAAPGIVVSAVDNGYGYNALVIQHDGGVSTVYGHVSQYFVTEGDRVDAGQIVALSGATPGTKGAGRITTGPHLHFEVWMDGKPVDPMNYLP